MIEYKAFGKFLISGEYLILHGAQALAMPLTKKFQTLNIATQSQGQIHWQAFDENNKSWLEANFDLKNLELVSTDNEEPALKIQSLLKYIHARKPELFKEGLTLTTRMNFSANWGFGSSSTLISLLSQWSGVDAFVLQSTFFGGSGYDVACATAQTPLVFELQHKVPKVTAVHWDPPFKENLSFLYLGQKQNSRSAMAHFKSTTPQPEKETIKTVSALTKKFLESQDLKSFQHRILEHEEILSKLVGMKPVKERLFPDFPGEIKSLGGWGGDFVMVACQDDPESYFRSRGYGLSFKWKDLVALS